MGLVEALAFPVDSIRRYGSQWRLWPDRHILELHAAICHNLRASYPLYTFFESVFGTVRAQQVAGDNGWSCPTGPSPDAMAG